MCSNSDIMGGFERENEKKWDGRRTKWMEVAINWPNPDVKFRHRKLKSILTGNFMFHASIIIILDHLWLECFWMFIIHLVYSKQPNKRLKSMVCFVSMSYQLWFFSLLCISSCLLVYVSLFAECLRCLNQDRPKPSPLKCYTFMCVCVCWTFEVFMWFRINKLWVTQQFIINRKSRKRKERKRKHNIEKPAFWKESDGLKKRWVRRNRKENPKKKEKKIYIQL